MNLSVNRISLPQTNHNNLRKVGFGDSDSSIFDDQNLKKGTTAELLKKGQEETKAKGTVLERLNKLEAQSKFQTELNGEILETILRSSSSNWNPKDYARFDSLVLANKVNRIG